MSSQKYSRGEKQPTCNMHWISYHTGEGLLVEVCDYRPDPRWVWVGITSQETTLDLCLTQVQLESLVSQLGIALREHQARTTGTCPVTGDRTAFTPPVELPEGEHWYIQTPQHNDYQPNGYRIASSTTNRVYARGLTFSQAQAILEGLQDPTTTVQLAD